MGREHALRVPQRRRELRSLQDGRADLLHERQLAYIQPLVRRPFDGAVEEVEAVNVHVGSHSGLEKQRPALRHGLAPGPRRGQGGKLTST